MEACTVEDENIHPSTVKGCGLMTMALDPKCLPRAFWSYTKSSTRFNGYLIRYKGTRPSPFFVTVNMETTRRVFPFNGNDAEYIRFLESKLLEAQPFLHPLPYSIPQPSFPGIPTASDRQFINFSNESFNSDVASKGKSLQLRTRAPQWEKELVKFLASVPAADKWNNARKDSGFATVDKNKLAIQLMLGRPANTSMSLDSCRPGVPLILPTDKEDIVLRGCNYGNFSIRCAEDGKFAVRVAKYQQLVFVCYCTVLIFLGVSKETVNWMMRQYISDSDDKNLERYRSGCLWVNRCISQLLTQGWGYKSWEIFLLC